jgi:hypothetical protein
MAELKTQKTKESVPAYINAIPDAKQKAEAHVILALMKRATGFTPVMWGKTMIGFGEYYYESAKSAQKGHWPLTAYAPRKNMHTIYIMAGCAQYQSFLTILGPHKHTVSCLHLKTIQTTDLKVLEALIKKSVVDMRKKYPFLRVNTKRKRS